MIVGIHGGKHNSSITIARENKIDIVIEIERLTTLKNDNLNDHNADFIKMWLHERGYISDDTIDVYYTEGDTSVRLINRVFGDNVRLHGCSHHYSHASGGFYQSDYDNAIIVSADGMGNDGSFNVYYAERGKDLVTLESRSDTSLGHAYNDVGWILADVTNKDTVTDADKLTWAGKVMGLAALGNSDRTTIDKMKVAMQSPDWLGSMFGGLRVVGRMLNIDINKRLSGQQQFDFVANWQKAFEEIMIERTAKHLSYSNAPIIFTGGCALNILMTARAEHELQRDVFVPCNPDDRGISAGLVLNVLRPAEKVELMYMGVSVEGSVPPLSTPLSAKKVAADLVNGKVYGVMKGRSEVGARALGHRSIICYPGIADMKDTLNAKIKNREWYRPFAPIVREHEVGKYFTRNKQSPYMAFASGVNEEYKRLLPSIVHNDGTARVQTIDRETNAFMWDVLTEVKRLTGIGVLINTSFNVDGQPMITYTDQAFGILKSTDIDGVIIGDQFWTKQQLGKLT